MITSGSTVKLFHKYDRCRGVTLFRYGQRNVELWFCPRGYRILEHTHPREDIELMFIAGEATFYRRDLNTGEVDVYYAEMPRSIGQTFTIKPHHSHWFGTATDKGLIFINFSRWHKGHKPTSAADDFQLTAST